tara:strand:- start:783 stop:1136 length:354 start_codon:yes stop_codon:yes gene_type:complete
MKAKISYTVNLEEIPEEVSGIIQKLQFQIDELVTGPAAQLYPIGSENIAGSLETIDNVRRSMAEIDLRLEECYSILYGYHQAVNQSINKFNDTQELGEKLSELGENLEHLKQRNESD